MSLVLSLYLVGGLGSFVGKPAAAGAPLAVSWSSQAGKKKPRRSPRRAAPAPSSAPDMPSLEDLPLGAQDLLKAGPSNLDAPGKASPAAAPRRGAEEGGLEAEAAPSPEEEAWRQALEEARRDLREAEAEKQRQENGETPTPVERDVILRIAKAREAIRRLLEEGKGKQYREQP
ncbi:MAG: hypothetical protein CFK52_09980 [Chloracidobacterium sp. CP2_5A]|nr:MAG: hypothetical protein CFK52_09980 [Chloracidobacterium sp. CP2_5A]